MTSVPSLESQVAEWRAVLTDAAAMQSADIDELESHLRDTIDELVGAGLSTDEAFLIAVKRLGDADTLDGEYTREHADRLWKQLMILPSSRPVDGGGIRRMLAFAVAGAALVLAPRFVGMDPEALGSFFGRNVGLLGLAALVAWLADRRGLPRRTRWLLAGSLAVVAAVVNAYPFESGGDTEILAALHVPVLAWGVVGLAYMGGEWRSSRLRMDFVRFTGEWFVYYVLIALGGGVFVGLTIGTFGAMGVDTEDLVVGWLLPSAAAGAVVVAAWLVEAKQRVIENIVPVLTAVFTPLFGLMLLGSIGAAFVTGLGVETDRVALVLLDALLIVVTGLVLYSISARDPDAQSGTADILQLITVAAAIGVDLIGLGAMVIRISEFGFSPNKTVALGLNLILLVSLGQSARLLFRFTRGRGPFGAVELWQTTTLPMYAGWAVAVVVAIPIVFGFE